MMRLTCAKMETLREAYLLDTLSEWQRRRAAAHLAACPRCREALEQARTRLSQLDAAQTIEPPAGLAERTLARIAGEETTTATRGFWNRRRLANVYAAVLAAAALFVVLPLFEEPRSGVRPSIQNNLKQFALIYKMYAMENPGEKYPPVAAYDGVWVPDLRVLYPEYLSDPQTLVDPGAPPRVKAEMEAAFLQEPPDLERAMRLMAETYAYHGWVTRDAADVEEIRRFQISRRARDTDIITENTQLYRLREGVERFLITDINNPAASAIAQSTLPVMIARPQSYRAGEGLLTRWWRRFKERMFGVPAPQFVPTLYMDGHVALVPLEEAPSNIRAMVELLPEEHSSSD